MTGYSLMIDDLPLYVESIDADEAYGRRNIKSTPIEGGKYIHTELGEYIPRQLTFKSHVTYPIGKSDKYNKKFHDLQNKIVKITSKELGVFNANVQIVPKWDTPGAVELSIKVTENTGEPKEPAYINPVDTQKADEEARKKAGAKAVSNKSTKTKDKNKKATATKKKTK